MAMAMATADGRLPYVWVSGQNGDGEVLGLRGRIHVQAAEADYSSQPRTRTGVELWLKGFGRARWGRGGSKRRRVHQCQARPAGQFLRLGDGIVKRPVTSPPFKVRKRTNWEWEKRPGRGRIATLSTCTYS